MKKAIFLSLFVCLSTVAMAETVYERELIVTDKSRQAEVENVFRQMLEAYEDEDARSFLDDVSEEDFRQDYINFEDALYEDFRNYDIHRVDYWIDRITESGTDRYFYFRWEKRYENIDNAEQLESRGFSRMLFEQVNGKYMLTELAGNDLFGSSYSEWTNETPHIPGNSDTNTVASSSQSSGSGGPSAPAAKADYQVVGLNVVSWGAGGLTVEVQIKNNAATATDISGVLVTIFEMPGPRSGSAAVAPIAAGATVSIPVLVVNAGMLAVGAENPAGDIQVTVDPDNDIDESDETNNVTGYNSIAV